MVSAESESSWRLAALEPELSASSRVRCWIMRSCSKFCSTVSIPRSMSRHSLRMALGSPWPKPPALWARGAISTLPIPQAMSVCGGRGQPFESKILTSITLSGWAVVATAIAVAIVTAIALVRRVVWILATVSVAKVSKQNE